MPKNLQSESDEINLIMLLHIIWEGKSKIILAMIISAILVFSFQAKKMKNFTARTEIQPITFFEENKYAAFNQSSKAINNLKLGKNSVNTDLSLRDKNIEKDNDKNKSNVILSSLNQQDMSQLFFVSREELLKFYVNVLNEKKVFEDAIIKFKLLDENDYLSKEEYNEAIIKFASLIKIKTDFTSNKKQTKQKKNQVPYPIIEFSYSDFEKWKLILKHVHEVTNQSVQQNLQDHFDNIILYLRQKNEFMIDDLSVQIDNLNNDYEQKTINRISYLNEQSEIAKELGIQKNTIEVQTFNNQMAFLTNNMPAPTYLRGHEAIDKEIELIKSRNNKSAFIPELLGLEQKKRIIEQDKTLDRLELVFASTPLAKNQGFTAASSKIFATELEYISKKQMLAKALLLGLIIGVFYVFISSAIQSQKIDKKK